MEQLGVITLGIFLVAGLALSAFSLVRANGRDEDIDTKTPNEIKVQSTITPQRNISNMNYSKNKLNLHPSFNKNVTRGADGRFKSLKNGANV